MTKQSRVDAVARAIDPEAFRWMGTSFHNSRALQAAYEKAELAIEASDAWLKEQGWEMAPAGSLLASRRASDPPQRKGLGVVVIDSSEEITSDMSDALNRAIDKGPDK